MDTEELKLLALRLRVVLEEIMSVSETVIGRRYITFRGGLSLPVERAFPLMRDRLSRLGFAPMLRRLGDEFEVRVAPRASAGRSNPLVNILLFVLTVGSTLFVGAFNAGVNLIEEPWRFTAGLPFAGSILIILGVHEFGHYLMSGYHRVKATLPYFIPAPTIIGTFGAVIKTKSPIPDRKGLLDIGAAGPICGFIVAVVAFAVGLSLSRVEAVSAVMRGGTIELGDSLLTWAMTALVKGDIPPGREVMLHPIAFAGWVGLLITAFNLMPVGQLDGGHVAYSILGGRHLLIARLMIAALLVAGFFWPYWYIWALLVLMLGPSHPPPLNDVTPLNGGRKAIAAVCIILFVICVVPVPVK